MKVLTKYDAKEVDLLGDEPEELELLDEDFITKYLKEHPIDLTYDPEFKATPSKWITWEDSIDADDTDGDIMPSAANKASLAKWEELNSELAVAEADPTSYNIFDNIREMRDAAVEQMIEYTNAGIRNTGHAMVSVADLMNPIGGIMYKTASTAKNFWKYYAPVSYEAYGGDNVFGSIDEIARIGTALGGWDALAEAGASLKINQVPNISEKQKKALYEMSREMIKAGLVAGAVYLKNKHFSSLQNLDEMDNLQLENLHTEML